MPSTSSREPSLPVQFSPDIAHNIPEELRQIPRWIRWTMRGKRKVPHGSILDESIAGPFSAVAEGSTGIGFLLTDCVRRKRDGAILVALDLDAARDPVGGGRTVWADRIISALDSYTERTPSDTGYRIWVWVRQPPGPLPRLPIPDVAIRPDPAGSETYSESTPGVRGAYKRPEVQVFGLGPAQYVTVTGKRVGSARPIRRIDGKALLAALPPLPPESRGAAGHRLPTGNPSVPSPSMDEIELAVRAAPEGPALIEGQWMEVGTPSASEAWWRLVRHVLRAARGDGETAVDFLLTRTAFGAGLVDSFDPAKYTKRSWVEADVIRVAGRSGEVDPATDRPTLQFEPVDPATIAAIETEDAQDGHDSALPWILPAEKYLADGFHQSWLIHPLLPSQGWVQLFGPPSSGKTPLGMSLALSVAAGVNQWHGYDIDRPGTGVLYMVGEGEAGIRARYTAQRERLREDHPDLDPHPNVYFTTRPGSLTDDKDSRAWVKQTQKTCRSGVSLVVIDTQNLNFGPGDENSTEDMTRFVLAIKRLSRALDCLVVTIHHSGLTQKDRARGSSVQFGALDAQFEVSLAGGIVTATPRKIKDSAMPESPLRAVLEARTLGEDARGRPVTAVCLRECSPEDAVGRVFEAVGGGGDTGVGGGTDGVEKVNPGVLAHFLRAVHEGLTGHRGLFGRARGKVTARVEAWAISQDLVRKVSRAGQQARYELRPDGERWVRGNGSGNGSGTGGNGLYSDILGEE